MAVVPAGYSLIGELVEEPGAEVQRGSADTQEHGRAGGMGQRRVLVHASGALQSPYADVKPSGLSPADAPRKLWHSSPHSSGR
jgi:error-prone DNA polymerase